jgi:hypothetical protein
MARPAYIYTVIDPGVPPEGFTVKRELDEWLGRNPDPGGRVIWRGRDGLRKETPAQLIRLDLRPAPELLLIIKKACIVFPMSSLISAEVMKAHRAAWFVWAGGVKMPHQSTMRGLWGYDATCLCGEFETRTGGATRQYVEDELWLHRFSAQGEEAR